MTIVKVCGITNLEDAQAAIEAGADMLGFVFYPPSPRHVMPERIAEIISVLRPSSSVRFVGVFVNEAVGRMHEIVEQCGLDVVQLSGDEPPEVMREFWPRACKALRPRDADETSGLLNRYCAVVDSSALAFLFDAFSPKLYGGTGERADWTLACSVARRFPILLAGGLTPDNVVAAIETVQPWGVDVSSGIERAPGLKDHAKMRTFVERAKQRRRQGGTKTGRRGERK
jgi:phosphoribosylanthranilate isomerase